jgi:hypothetical protein
MIRFAAAAAVTLLIGGCAAGMGAPRDIDMPIAALNVGPDAAPAAVAATVRAADARAVFLAAPRDSAWFSGVAAATEMQLSGPTHAGGIRMAFLGPEPVGDTTLVLEYEGGGLMIQDALYEIRDERYLDLIAFRIEPGMPVGEAVAALLSYVATDVDNVAAVAMAVAVPDAATGESVARMLGPAYFDALRCGGDDAVAPAGEHVRLFYGPAARMFCESARSEATAAGDLIRAQLVMGRR